MDNLIQLHTLLAELIEECDTREIKLHYEDLQSLKRARKVVAMLHNRSLIPHSELEAEVREIMKGNHDDYCAEEYDERFDYTKYNNFVREINNAREIWGFIPHEMWETTDYSEMCALVERERWGMR